MDVVGVEERVEGVVVEMRARRDVRRVSSIRRKGRYLFASSAGWLPFGWWVPFTEEDVGSESCISISAEPLVAMGGLGAAAEELLGG